MSTNARELLRVLRIQGVELRAEGGKLRSRPRDAVLSATREAISQCKKDLLAVLTDSTAAIGISQSARASGGNHVASTECWPGADANELIRWFNTTNLPHQPFGLASWRRVTNPALFFRTLREDLARGPAGPHIHHRCVLEDIRLLHEMFANGGRPHGNVDDSPPPRQSRDGTELKGGMP